MKRVAGLYVAWLVAAGLLVSAAVERHPYSFYTLLRWICCPVFAYSAFAAHEKNRLPWAWIFGVLAVLYNPIFRVHLDRSAWIGVNWFTVGVIVVATVVFWRNDRQSSVQSVAADLSCMNIKFECPSCGQQISSTEDMAGSPAECPKCSHPFVVPIAIRRANEIVDLIETVLTSGNYVANHFTPLSRVGASNRLEVLHALYIVTAQSFQQTCLRTARPDAQNMFDEFARGAGGAAFRIVSSFLPDVELDHISKLPNHRRGDPSDEQYRQETGEFAREWQRLTSFALNDVVFKQTETMESFVSFLRTLDPAERDYWVRVYQRMGVPCPLET